MSEQETLTIGLEIYDSKKHARDYFASLIRETGVCESVKQKNEHTFYLMVDVLKRHPNRVKKGLIDRNGECQILDISVGQSQIKIDETGEKNALYLCVVLPYVNEKYNYNHNCNYNHNQQVKKLKVTWTKCLRPKSEGFFYKTREAMRYEIQPQIDYFHQVFQTAKQCSQVLSIMGSRCIHCMTDKQIDLVEADYFALFPILAEKFVMKLDPSELPSDFEMCPDTYWMRFREEDRLFKERWTEYFFDHAKPRWVCQGCLHDPDLYSILD